RRAGRSIQDPCAKWFSNPSSRVFLSSECRALSKAGPARRAAALAGVDYGCQIRNEVTKRRKQMNVLDRTRKALGFVFAIGLMASLAPVAALAGGDWNDSGIAWRSFDDGLKEA